MQRVALRFTNYTRASAFRHFQKSTLLRLPLCTNYPRKTFSQCHGEFVVRVQPVNKIICRSYADIALSRNFITERVMLVLRLFDKIDAEKLTLDSHLFEDMGIDSLDHVEVMMAMEEEFHFEIPDEDALRLKKPSDIVQYICDKYDVFE